MKIGDLFTMSRTLIDQGNTTHDAVARAIIAYCEPVTP